MTASAAATLDEAVSSWDGWVRTAEAVGDEELATCLVEAAPAGALETKARTVVLARGALLRGRPQDAADRLRGTRLRSPEDARAADVVAAAARACTTTDVSDYRWLIAHVAHARGTAEAVPALRLLAAVADHRGDPATADSAWEELASGTGLHTHQALARLASTIVTRRDREARPASLVALTVHAATVGLTGPPFDHPDVGRVTAAATSLVERGDPAGAALLLRAVRLLADEDDGTSIDATLTQIVPVRRRRLFSARRTAAALAGATLGLGAALADSRTWLLVPLLAVAGWALRERLSRLHPFTVPERRAWRDLARLRIDGATGQVVGRQRDALGALFAILGSLAGIAAALQVSVWVADGLGLDSAWTLATVWALVAPAPAVTSLLLLSKARAALDARARRTRFASDERRERVAAGRCTCWHSSGIVGRAAVRSLDEHLVVVPSSGAVSAALAAVRAGSVTARCPASGTLWLAVPTAAGSLLLLKGAVVPRRARLDRLQQIPRPRDRQR